MEDARKTDADGWLVLAGRVLFWLARSSVEQAISGKEFSMRLHQAGRALALAAFAVILAAVAGCGQHSGGAGAPSAGGDASSQGSDYQSQAERTKAMEAKARELDQKAAEIQNMQGTEQEKIDAVNKLEQERQELNRMGGDSSTPATPPPQ
jgi:hypothetical protein